MAVSTILLFVPLILILWAANWADRRQHEGQRHPLLALMAHGPLCVFYAILGLVGVGLYLQGTSPMPLDPQTLATYQAMGIAGDGKAGLVRLGLGILLPALAGSALLLRPARRLVARVLPIHPERTVHAVALSYSTLILTNLLVTLSLGLGSLADTLEAHAGTSPGYAILSAWVQACLWSVMSILGVGWLSRRSLGQALARLGVVRPSWRQLAVGCGVGLGLVPLVLAGERVAASLGLSADAEVIRLTEALIGPLFSSLPGVLTLGFAAALGEEAVFRGAAQPRLGLWFTTMLFALTHSNYGLTFSTAIVLLLGLLLGLLRQRANTSTAMAAHATYNIALGLLAFLGLF